MNIYATYKSYKEVCVTPLGCDMCRSSLTGQRKQEKTDEQCVNHWLVTRWAVGLLCYPGQARGINSGCVVLDECLGAHAGSGGGSNK